MEIALTVTILVTSGLIGMVLDLGYRVKKPALYWFIGVLGGVFSLTPWVFAS